jgi:hypothetical protein
MVSMTVYEYMKNNTIQFIFNLCCFTLSYNKCSKRIQIRIHWEIWMRIQWRSGSRSRLLQNKTVIPFFFLNCFWWTEVPIVFHIFLCRPSEDSLQQSAIPDGSQSKDWQSTVVWGDYWIRTQDCIFTIWCRYQWTTTTPCNSFIY